MHYRAQLDNLMDKVLTQVGEVAKATQKVSTATVTDSNHY